MEEGEGDFFFNQAEVSAGLDAAGKERLAALEDRLQLPSADEFSALVSEERGEQRGVTSAESSRSSLLVGGDVEMQPL
jgi:hypothetical protein